MQPIDVPLAQGDEPYVFVCYAHADADKVYVEIEWLVREDVSVWYDRGISAGTNWRSAIGDSLLGAQHLLYFISERSLASEHCNREVSLALDEGITIVPIYLHDVELTSDFKIGLSRVQALRYEAADYRPMLLNALSRTESSRPQLNQLPPGSFAKSKPLRRYLGLGLGALLVAITAIFFLYNQYNPLGGPEDAQEPAVELTSEALQSVVVLPFVNMSDQASLGFFARGLSEGILDALAQGDLKVASRTAAFKLADEGVGLQTIAAQLKVAYVLEGSVQQMAEELRITAQLIRAIDGYHIWSKTYDRNFNDGFTIQKEVADNVAHTTVNKLWIDVQRQHPELFDEFTGVDPAAISYYLDSIDQYNQYISGESGDPVYAFELAKKAVEIDPDFLLAQSEIAWNYMMRIDTSLSVAESIAGAHAAVERVLEVDPDSVDALAMLAQIYMHLDLDYANAQRTINRGKILFPEGEWWSAFEAGIAGRENRWDDVKKLFKQASVKMEGSDQPTFLTLYAEVLLYFEDYQQSLEIADEALNLVGGGAPRAEVLLTRAGALLALNRNEQAQKAFDEAWRLSGSDKPENFAALFAQLGNTEKARNILANATIELGNRGVIVDGYLALGEYEKTFKIIRAGIEDHDVSILDRLSHDILDPIRQDSRFIESLDLLDSKVKHTAKYLAQQAATDR